MTTERRVYQFGFVIEQVLGHITHGDNLRAHVPLDTDVRAHWILPSYPVSGVAGRVPIYRSNWTVRSGLMTRRSLLKISKTTHLDALFIHTQVPAMLSPDWIRRVPTVLSIDATPQQYDELGAFYQHATGSARVEQIKSRAARARFANARHVVAWSEWAKQGLVDQYDVPDDKVTVIPPGVTVADWSPESRADDEGPVKLLFVGGDLERKGGLLLIEAFRELRSNGVELHLVTRDSVDEEPGLFVHRGIQPNSPALRQLYRDSDIFVMPTFGDCLPMVLSEAGAAGLPTVTTDVAAIPEVVVDGETGILVPPGDLGALTSALRRLVDDRALRALLGERAAEHIAKNYDTHTNTQRLLALLKSIADDETGA